MSGHSVINQWHQAQEIPHEHEPVEKYTAKTFGWMSLGLMVTFLVPMTEYTTGAIIYIFMIPYAIFVLATAEVAVILFLSARIDKMSMGAARGLFFLYTALNGIVFSAYFLTYSMLDVVVVFAATSVFFGVMAAVGYVTKADLSRLRNFLVGGLVSLVTSWLFGMFTNLAQPGMVACTVGIFVFLLFTAYDTQKIKTYHAAYGSSPGMAKRVSIFSALWLYLDLVNLSLYLPRVLGRRE